MLLPNALIAGIAAAGTRLRRRNSARSMPVSSAARSISRSTIVDHLGIAGAAQHAVGRGVREHAGDTSAIAGMRYTVPGQECVLEGLHAAAAARQIGAEIGVAGDAQCQKASVTIERQFRLGAVAAALVIGEKNLAAAGDPFDRTADPLRRPRDQHVLGIDEILRAEPAADIGRDKAQPRRLDAERARQPRRGSRAGSGPRHARCSGRSPGHTGRQCRAAPSGW